MDVSFLLDSLNEAQRTAVSAPPGPLLILAGAGSGKTRVLTHRIAWLVQVENVSPHGLLAVTFTNKAAGEMRARTEQLINTPAAGLWVGTFHSLAHRLLRRHWREADLPQNFQILDADDQFRLLRRVLKALNLDEAKWPPKQAQWFINGRKDEGQRPGQIDPGHDVHLQHMLRIYTAYEDTCRRGGMVDFAELLLRAYELWARNAELLEHYRARFQHVLVDEFQDTNALQYAWLRLVAGATGNLFAVGDDDQSIYGWRGARIENLHRFSKDFPNTKIVRLEQNYRSTANILSAANALIAHNSARLGKNLWTQDSSGAPLILYTAFNDLDEAHFVTQRIRLWVEAGHRYNSVGVLYRSNAQSRVLEESLVASGIPYRVYGGQRFFERQEIKDALAYLRLCANPADDASFERVVHTPPRGLGERSLDALRTYAKTETTSLWEAAKALSASTSAVPRTAGALTKFVSQIEELSLAINGLGVSAQVHHVITGSGLIAHYEKESGERGQARVENLEELVNAAREFERQQQATDMDPISAFLSHAALEAGDAESGAGQDCVQLMTLHSAKGLEFPLAFMCGMEEGLFPHQLSRNDPHKLEEERRLCYVGMTRARLQLYLTCAERRRLHGTETCSLPSRFISEIPAELIQEIRPRVNVTRPYVAPTIRRIEEDAPYRLGQRVKHASFGEGIILNCEGAGEHARVQVNFTAGGAKWLLVNYAKLQTLQ